MQVDQEASDYIDSLQAALRDCNMVLWAMVKASGGRIDIRTELMTLFNAETSVLYRWKEYEGEVFSCYPRKEIALPDGSKKTARPN